MNLELCFLDSSMLLWFHRFFWSWADKEEAAKLYQEGEEIKRKSKVSLLVPLLSIFIKESESRLYLFVSKIATNISGNSSIRVDTIPGNKMATPLGSE